MILYLSIKELEMSTREIAKALKNLLVGFQEKSIEIQA